MLIDTSSNGMPSLQHEETRRDTDEVPLLFPTTSLRSAHKSFLPCVISASRNFARIGLVCIVFALLLLSAAVTSAFAADDTKKGPLFDDSIDVAYVLDNNDHIAQYDPNNLRYAVGRFLANALPLHSTMSVVRVPGTSEQSKRMPLIIEPPHTINSDADRVAIASKFTSATFGDVDMGGTTYFDPGLEAGENALLKVHDGNKKFLILASDVLLLSGDTGTCGASYQHQWLCVVDRLQKEGITVILLAFSPNGVTPPNFQEVQNYVASHGGMVQVVPDSSAHIAQVAELYTDVLDKALPNVFVAHVTPGSKPQVLSVIKKDYLTDLIFIAVGPDPDSMKVRKKQGSTAGLGHYEASGPGYQIEEFTGKGDDALVGGWLVSGSSPPTEVIILGISSAYTQLLNPAPTQVGNDGSVRLVAPDTPTILRTRTTDQHGNAIGDVSLVANPDSDNQAFSKNDLPMQALPGVNDADQIAMLGTLNGPLSIALGNGGDRSSIHLEKHYAIATDSRIPDGLTLTLPPTAIRNPGSVVTVQAKADSPMPLALLEQDPNTSTWQPLATASSGSFAGSFKPQFGCGEDYPIAVITEVQGRLPDGSVYDDVLAQKGTFKSHFPQHLTEMSSVNENASILWWQPENLIWKVTYKSTACGLLHIQLGSNQSNAHVNMQMSQQGTAVDVMPGDSITQTVRFTIQCPTYLMTNVSDTIMLKRISTLPQDVTVVPEGTWSTTLICASLVNVDGQALPLSAEGILLLIIGFVVCISILSSPLSGSIDVIQAAHVSAITGTDTTQVHPRHILHALNDFAASVMGVVTATRTVYVRPPFGRSRAGWYLMLYVDKNRRRRYRLQLVETVPATETHLAVLQLKVEQDARTGSWLLKFAATPDATGQLCPMIHGEPVGSEFRKCFGQEIHIGEDVLHLKLDCRPPRR